jgi:hypothetical protein
MVITGNISPYHPSFLGFVPFFLRPRVYWRIAAKAPGIKHWDRRNQPWAQAYVLKNQPVIWTSGVV